MKWGDILLKYENSVPVYLQIAESITKDIISGKYKMGAQIPSVRELAVLFNANPNTCQKAVTELVEEGLLDSVSTTGKFVTNDENILKECRDKILIKLTNDFIKEVTAFNFNKEEILEILRKENNNGIN